MEQNEEIRTNKIRIQDDDGQWIWVDIDSLNEDLKFLHEEELKAFLKDSKNLSS